MAEGRGFGQGQPGAWKRRGWKEEDADRKKEIEIRASAPRGGGAIGFRAEQSAWRPRKTALLEKERARRSQLVAILACIGALIVIAAFVIWSHQIKEALYRLQSVRALTAAQERALKPGDPFKECSDCPEMVIVPAKPFKMGSPEGEGDESERPQHEVKIAKPFAVGEVRTDLRRMGRLRRPWRLQPACRRRRLGARPAAGDQRGLGRRAGLCEMALMVDRQVLSAALRGRIRICGARRNRDQISLGRRHQARRQADGQLRRLRRRVGRQADGAGRLVPGERVRSLRHGRQRLGVDGGLLERQLRRRAGRWRRMDERRLQSPRRPRRFLDRRSRSSSAPRTASGPSPAAGTTSSGSGSPGRLPLKS